MRRTIRTAILAMALILVIGIAGTAANTSMVWADTPSQQGSAPDKPTGLSATASHDSVTLTWDDPKDDSITGYVILRRVRENDTGGKFSELVPNTGSTATTYTDDTVVAGTTYTYRIKATSEHGVSERSRWFHIETLEVPERPDKPRGLSATATHDRVVLTWDDPGDDSITGYVILRRVRENDTGGEFGVLVADTGSAATTYTDDTVVAGTTYTYRIKAINEHGVSPRSRWFHIDTPAAPEPEADPADRAPSGLTAVLTDGQVVLAWDAPAEDAGSVTGYEVLRGQEAADPTTLVADTGNTATTYTDATAAGAGYAYRVKAIRDGERSGASNEARVRLRPARPTGLTAEAIAHDTVTLTWDDPQDDSVTGYAVVRWTLGYNSSGIVTIAADTGTADPSYTDETVQPRSEYLYNIKAINAQGESKKSEPLRVKTPQAPDPALLAPANTTAELVDGQVVLGWDAPVLDAGAVTGYEVLRGQGWDDPVTLVADTGNTATTHIDATADAPGESYAYGVKAVRDGERSQASDAALIQLPDQPPSAPSGLIASFGSGGLSLVWNAPTEDASTVTGYEVLRAQGGDALTTLAADTGNAATAYTDFSAGGVSERYAYRVRAIRGEERSADSNEARVQLPLARPTRVDSAASSDLVLLSWADPQDDSVTGYRILRRLWAGDEPDDFRTLAEDTGSADTAYADDTVATGRVYVYRVLAINPGGVSEPSQDLRVRTAAPVAPPEPARGLPSQTTQQVRQNVSEPSGDDFAADDSTQGRLEVGGSVTGNIDRNGDRDAFAMELVQGRTYRFDLEGSETEKGTLADPQIIYIFLLDSVGDVTVIPNSTDADSGDGENSRLTFALPSGTTYPTGTYYILVEEHGGDATGTYRLSMEQVAGSGYGKTYPVEGNLQPGSTLSGTLPVHDGYFGNPYYFALEDLEVGRYTVSFSTGDIDSIHTFWRRPDNPDLDDVWILTDQAFGRSSYTFDVRPHRVGTHYALLYIREGAGGDFTATLEEAPPSLTVGGPAVDGRIKSGGQFSGYGTYMLFYSVDLEDGETYQVDVKGKDTCNDCTMDHTMLGHIQAPDGSFVEGDNNLFVYGGGEGRNTRYVFTADQDGTYFLKVGGRIFTVSGASRYRRGTFKVSIQEVP